MRARKNKIRIKLVQGRKIRTKELVLSIYKPGVSQFVYDIDLGIKQMRYLLKGDKRKIIDMQLNKTGKLFSFSTIAPLIIANKFGKINQFKKIGLDIGLLFQIIDDFLDYSGSEKKIGKKTGKDKKKGKATLISLLGYKNAVKYSSYLKNRIISSLSKYKSKDLIETVEFVVNRKK